MSLTNFLRRVLSGSTDTQSPAFFSEKTGGHHDYYHYGSYKKPKSKSKSEKKHAVLSALTLLAFLFFLNILQNCIREQQNQTRGTVMMFGPSAPTAPQTKYQPIDPAVIKEDTPPRKKRSPTSYESQENKSEYSAPKRKSRSLLSVLEPKPITTNRQVKFISNYKTISNWTSALSQVSDKELEDQKLKTVNLTTYRKVYRYPSPVTQFPFYLRKIKKREGNWVSPAAADSKNQTDQVTSTKLNWKNQNFHLKNSSPGHNNSQRYESGPVDDTWRGFSQVSTTHKPQEIKNNGPFQRYPPPLQKFKGSQQYTVTTPRNMRSDYSSTVRSVDYDDYERISDQSQSPGQALGLDLNTYQTYPVYNYYNHRQNIYRRRENDTTESLMTESSTKDEDLDIDRMHNDIDGTGTQNSLFYPTKTPQQHYKYSSMEKTKYPVRRPDLHSSIAPYHGTTHYRYKYSPYRKAGTYEPSRFHDDYIVVARYPQDEDPGFDFSKFLWTVFTSFAKPLTNLMPGLAKDNNEDSQCYDLLVCEAQRVSKFMGPTAEALTITLGTLLSWAVTEDTRQTVIDALNSGRENTCQQQIKNCEDRSGGKSAMTVIAQVMEMKLR